MGFNCVFRDIWRSGGQYGVEICIVNVHGEVQLNSVWMERELIVLG